ncbi:aminodeoxychorismate/anthranilate synthase component II [Oligoflexus tunisiensis]|uniref:aminodeoxychorismate/anthranilate synthase component II n=1 Tax=Oligoflexus tunisiensis TaxID=708132 RepID=UPI000B32F383|nr:aminodeoxychorismate/anthranilate synthase component II [Oligoflexus tunisiensis]
MQVCFLDHYDSFSFNLIDWLFSDTGLELVYKAYDTPGVAEALRAQPMPLVLSPGPKDPLVLPETMSIVREQLGKVPIFGICLGHQCLGLALGGCIARARHPFHGSAQRIDIAGHSQFLNELPADAQVARYNSLVVKDLPGTLATAWNADQEIEALEDFTGRQPVIGVQFHPESFLSVGVESLKRKWTELVRAYYHPPA